MKTGYGESASGLSVLLVQIDREPIQKSDHNVMKQLLSEVNAPTSGVDTEHKMELLSAVMAKKTLPTRVMVVTNQDDGGGGGSSKRRVIGRKIRQK